MSAYLFFVGDLLLPFAPERMEQHYRSSTKTTTTIEKGEILLLNRKGLLEFNFTFIIPQSDMGFIIENYGESLRESLYRHVPTIAGQLVYSAKWYLDLLVDFKNNSKVFTFTVLQSGFSQDRLLNDICLPCVIDSLKINYGSFHNNVLAIDLTLLEYRLLEIEEYSLRDTTIQTPYRPRLATTVYDTSNLNPYLSSGVHFLERQVMNIVQMPVRTFGETLSTVYQTVSTAVQTVENYLPPLLVRGIKVAGWFALKTVLINSGLAFVGYAL